MKRKAAKNAIKKLNTSNQKKKKKLSSTVQKKKLNKLRRSGLLNTKSTRSLSKSKERHRSESETSNSDVESACPAKKAKTEVKKKVQPPSRRSSSNTVKDEGDDNRRSSLRNNHDRTNARKSSTVSSDKRQANIKKSQSRNKTDNIKSNSRQTRGMVSKKDEKASSDESDGDDDDDDDDDGGDEDDEKGSEDESSDDNKDENINKTGKHESLKTTKSNRNELNGNKENTREEKKLRSNKTTIEHVLKAKESIPAYVRLEKVVIEEVDIDENDVIHVEDTPVKIGKDEDKQVKNKIKENNLDENNICEEEESEKNNSQETRSEVDSSGKKQSNKNDMAEKSGSERSDSGRKDASVDQSGKEKKKLKGRKQSTENSKITIEVEDETDDELIGDVRKNNKLKQSDTEKKDKVKVSRELINLGLVSKQHSRGNNKHTNKSRLRSSKDSKSESSSESDVGDDDDDEDVDDEEEDEEDDEDEDLDSEMEIVSDNDSEVVYVASVSHSPAKNNKSYTSKSTPTSKAEVTNSSRLKMVSLSSLKNLNSGSTFNSFYNLKSSRDGKLPSASITGQTPALELMDMIRTLQEKMAKLKEDHRTALLAKDEEIKKIKEEPSLIVQRLKSELDYKTEQLDMLNNVAEKNLELEAKISYLLSSPENYQHELIQIQEKELREKLASAEREEVDDENDDESNEGTTEEMPKKRSRKKKGKKKDAEDDVNEADDIEILFVGSHDKLRDLELDFDAKTSGWQEEPTENAVKSSVESGYKVAEKEVIIVDGDDQTETGHKGRHDIRGLVTKLREETKLAAIMEAERRERVKKLREEHAIEFETDAITGCPVYTRLVLAFRDDDKSVPLVEVDKDILKHLKPHQVEAVEFMWDTVIESVDRLSMEGEAGQGSGCILAHCMGLGKSLSVLSLVQMLLANNDLSFRSCLIICPLNAVLNWINEWNKWIDDSIRPPVYELATKTDNKERQETLEDWKRTGGVLVMGYSLFRILVSYNGRSRKAKQTYATALIDPGPDIIVCDEGHILKNDASAVSKCVNRVRTKRRIVLTGTPLQNNLVEYHCMVTFVKPNLLGSRREFSNRFINPITNGQHSDSTSLDVKIMKRRAHVLHEMLAGCVQRKDYSALVKYLPPKFEFVISIRLSPLQILLYEKYLDKFSSNPYSGRTDSTSVAGLFSDYQALMRIWTHPWVLKLDEIRQEKKPLTFDDDDDLESIIFTSSDEEEAEKSDSDAVIVEDVKPKNGSRKRKASTDDEGKVIVLGNESGDDRAKDASSDEMSDTEGNASNEKPKKDRRAKIVAGEVIRAWQTKTRSKGPADEVLDASFYRREEQWWTMHLKDEDKFNLELSGKLVLLFDILRMSEESGDKVLVFSQSLLSLDIIEDFLSYKTEEALKQNALIDAGIVSGIKYGTYIRDEDYLRLDGSTNAPSRKRLTTNFNDVSNTRLRLFLISTKAGGLGINLDAANRVIIFDASWNPSHDVQSIFRVYRFGQVKPVFIYRFLAQGTMEEKIYDRQVTKETLSQRVVDEHQIDRHFTAADLQELYNFKPDKMDDPDAANRPTPAVPKDKILAELLSTRREWISQYHEHDSLLENRPEENLTEEERKAAWEEYEREKSSTYSYMGSSSGLTAAQQMRALQYQHQRQLQQQRQQQQQLVSMWHSQLNSSSMLKNTNSSSTGPTNSDLDAAALLAVRSIPPHLQNRFSFQISQLPRVIQEILKYNPNITADNLQTRLQAFLGMHSRLGGSATLYNYQVKVEETRIGLGGLANEV